MVYHVAGLMSGTSLDGLDIALCEFAEDNHGWHYSIIHSATKRFPGHFADRLYHAHTLDITNLLKLDRDFAVWCGEVLEEECSMHRFSPILAASHGHTVFHQPSNGITLQIGNGAVIAGVSGIPVVSDFRTSDICLGGQGAPLVPAGDRLLFPEYSACLNFGGIANISYPEGDDQTAYDICPCNIVLNHLAKRDGMPYDKNGIISSGGTILPELRENLNSIPWYGTIPPRSLSREQVEEEWMPLLDPVQKTADLMKTFCNHIAEKTAESLKKKTGTKTLVTGGGALNEHLIKELKSVLPEEEIIIPDLTLICFKEAMVFGFLGLLRWLGKDNVLASSTGASRDHCSGQIALP